MGFRKLHADDEAATAEFFPMHAHELEALDPRNALMSVDDIEIARLSGRRRRSLLCLELRTCDGREFSV
ncbi:MAG: hypothetical protein ACRDNS_00425 [Trebonia sp.]